MYISYLFLRYFYIDQWQCSSTLFVCMSATGQCIMTCSISVTPELEFIKAPKCDRKMALVYTKNSFLSYKSAKDRWKVGKIKKIIAILDTHTWQWQIFCFLKKLLSISTVCLLITYTLMFPCLCTKRMEITVLIIVLGNDNCAA